MRAKGTYAAFLAALSIVIAGIGGTGLAEAGHPGADLSTPAAVEAGVFQAAAQGPDGPGGGETRRAAAVADGRVIPLRQAIQEALTRGPHLRAAEARLKAAEAQAAQTAARVKGRVDGEVNGGLFSTVYDLPTDLSTRPPVPPSSVRVRGRQATGAVTWSGHLWLSPEGEAALAAARADVVQARKEWHDAVVHVVRNTTQAYLELLQAQGGLAVASRRRAWAEEAWRVTRQRFEKGQATEAELLEAEGERDQARADEEEAMRGRRLAANQLLLWMARPLDGSAVAVDPLVERDPVLEQVVDDLREIITFREGELQLDRDQAVGRALSRRWDVRLLEAQKAAAEAGVSVAEAEGKARVGVSAAYQWRNTELSAGLNRWGQGEVRAEGGARWNRPDLSGSTDLHSDEEWSIGFQVAWTLGDGGAQKHKEKEARSRVTMVDAHLEQLLPGIELEVDAAMQDVQKTLWAVRVAETRLQAAEKSLEQVERLYELEAATEVDVLGARVRRAAAELERNVARWHQIGADIRMAVATGWLPSVAEDVTDAAASADSEEEDG